MKKPLKKPWKRSGKAIAKAVKPKQKMTNSKLKRAIKLYAGGKSYAQIAKLIDLTPAFVAKFKYVLDAHKATGITHDDSDYADVIKGAKAKSARAAKLNAKIAALQAKLNDLTYES